MKKETEEDNDDLYRILGVAGLSAVLGGVVVLLVWGLSRYVVGTIGDMADELDDFESMKRVGMIVTIAAIMIMSVLMAGIGWLARKR